MLPFFYARVIDARGGIGATFAYLDSQLPFIYVHLLSVLVHAANAIVAIDAGQLGSQMREVMADIGIGSQIRRSFSSEG